MKLLKTISNKDFDLPVVKEEGRMPRIREAARAVLMDNDYKIALLFVSKKDYHKLPGGGLEEDENISQALEREILEETGCKAEVMTEIGEVEENRENFLLNQKSYCFSAKLIGEKGEPDFTDSEKDEGFILKWVSVEEAIKLIHEDKPSDYQGRFIQVRDLTLLKEFQRQIELNG
ncbi:MAG: ADP-ribose pyrophosphatase [Berkelbacteria bacterium GW2011_GWE1_39_12]|uniref:ADP-ribose pyrophosphatase n=1 Tax=Berkelbacteria bacterium GW2011_GWE1_39_12 TaxID=1618337 RepID=A0A0G4B4S4_9BACT|nr:MAG: ADP-ribose pyrophosphatase [Berkelbacteria bacterium GW2011_GWE1_39_12]